jgi:hypothetical protein
VRDIRHDLRERLVAISAKRKDLHRALDMCEVQEDCIKRMLAEEELLWESVSPRLFDEPAPAVGGTTLSQVLLDTLKAKGAPATLDELKDAAIKRGVPFGEKKPGRAIHFALIGMQQHALVKRAEGGRWTLAEQQVA